MVWVDEIAEDNSEDIWADWKNEFYDAMDDIAVFVAQKRGKGNPLQIVDWHRGSYNVAAQIRFSDGGPDAIIRYAKPGVTAFRDEKVRNEVAVMMFLRQHTSIPIPRVIGWGLTKDCPKKLGPYIIMDFVDGVKLSDILRDPAAPNEPILNPKIHPGTLKNVFGQIADIMLQMYRFDFRKIGAIEWDGSVCYRPLTYNDNELMALMDGFPRDILPSQPVSNATQYFKSLADRHITHLKIQRNVAETDDACREMYIARHLFGQLVAQTAAQDGSDNGPFKLFCDDMRPANMLVDPQTLQITAVIDWEYSYAAPAQYSQSPPPWLLLVSPETLMRRGYTVDQFEALYTPILNTFLNLLEEKEVARGVGNNQLPLSSLMRKNWVDGTFWWALAARKSFDVDDIFKAKLEWQYFGQCGGARLELIEDGRAKEALPEFVEQKRSQYRQYCQDLAMHQAQRAARAS